MRDVGVPGLDVDGHDNGHGDLPPSSAIAGRKVAKSD